MHHLVVHVDDTNVENGSADISGSQLMDGTEKTENLQNDGENEINLKDEKVIDKNSATADEQDV